jgi:acyl-CoA synthetase (AMP-forming)/AMP-acid ligase II
LFESLVSRLRLHAAQSPDAPAVVFLEDGESRETMLTYAKLHASAVQIARRLGCEMVPGARVVLAFAPGISFIQGFIGCLYAGAVAVPIYPPRLREGARAAERLARIIGDCGASMVLTTRDIAAQKAKLAGFSPGVGAVQWLLIDDIAGGEAADPMVFPESDTVAFLQYTSGSTSEPKGAIVTHGNLVANFAAIGPAMAIDASTVFLSWLPLNHDMGLIGVVLQALFLGCRLVLMSPFHFLQRPLRWPAAIARYRATLSGGPNFAYDLCVRRTLPEQRALLDLTCWKVAFNGAEPVRAATLDAFAAAFAVAGFQC